MSADVRLGKAGQVMGQGPPRFRVEVFKKEIRRNSTMCSRDFAHLTSAFVVAVGVLGSATPWTVARQAPLLLLSFMYIN